MLFQAEALRQVKEFLEAHRIPYMLVGGIANAIWGEIRATEDADLKVILTGGMTIADFRTLAEARFKPYRRPWLGRTESSLIVSVEVMPAMVVDMLVGVFPYEELAVRRAQWAEVEGVRLPVCTAEDLIIHKGISDRPKDWTDIEGILIRQRGRVDADYIRHWLKEFGAEIEKLHIVKRFDDLWAMYRPHS